MNEQGSQAADFKPLHRHEGMGVGLQYDGEVFGDSFYQLFARGLEGTWGAVAQVWVDKETRKIHIMRLDSTRTIPTNGIASIVFEDGKPRFSGGSVAEYVLPRMGRFLGLLLA